MTISYVQSKQTVGPDTGQSTIAAAFDSAVGGGQRLLIVGLVWFQTGDPNTNRVSTVTDTLGTAFSLALFKPGPNSGALTAVYYGLGPVSGNSDTVTVAWATTPDYQRLVITEVQGADLSAPFDAATATDVGTPATAVNSGSITTARAGSLIYGLMGNNTNGVTHSAGTNESFTLRQSNTVNVGSACEDAIQLAAGSTSAQFTLGTADVYNCMVVAFKAALASPSFPGGQVLARVQTLSRGSSVRPQRIAM